MAAVRASTRFFPSPDAPRQGDAADRVAVVVNGNAKGVTDALVDRLEPIVENGNLFVSRDLAEAREIARAVVEGGHCTVVIGGGDGTFVQMVSWIVQMAESTGRPLPRFGLLRLGTGNALARVIGANQGRGTGVIAELDRLRTERASRLLRLVEVEDLLTPFAGIGADAVALDHYARIRSALQRNRLLRPFAAGFWTYAAAILGRTIPEFAFVPPPTVRVVNEGSTAHEIGPDGREAGEPIEGGALVYEGPIRLLSFSTIPYWGFGARIFPYAEERADRFHLRIANLGAREVVGNIRPIWQGTFRHPGLRDYLVEEISVRCPGPMPLQVGGDVVGRRTSIRARLSRRTIRVVDCRARPPV